MKRASVPPPTIKTYFATIKTPASQTKEENGHGGGKGVDEKPQVKSAAETADLTSSQVADMDDDIVCILDYTPSSSKRKSQAKLSTFFTKKLKTD